MSTPKQNRYTLDVSTLQGTACVKTYEMNIFELYDKLKKLRSLQQYFMHPVIEVSLVKYSYEQIYRGRIPTNKYTFQTLDETLKHITPEFENSVQFVKKLVRERYTLDTGNGYTVYNLTFPKLVQAVKESSNKMPIARFSISTVHDNREFACSGSVQSVMEFCEEVYENFNGYSEMPTSAPVPSTETETPEQVVQVVPEVVMPPTPLPEVPEVQTTSLLEYYLDRELNEVIAAYDASDMIAVKVKIAQIHKVLSEN